MSLKPKEEHFGCINGIFIVNMYIYKYKVIINVNVNMTIMLFKQNIFFNL